MMDELYLVRIKYIRSYYDGDRKTEKKFHLVRAESYDDAYDKVEKFYKDKSDPYYDYYDVQSIEVAENIF